MCYAPNKSCLHVLDNRDVKYVIITQVTSTHYQYTRTESHNITIPIEKFNTVFDEWVIDYNISRTEQPIRIERRNVKCRHIGDYHLTVEFADNGTTTCTFNIRSSCTCI